MKKKLLISNERSTLTSKNIAVFSDPQRLKSILNKLSWKILQILSEKEMYPMEIAKKLNIHEQKVYYHIRKLAKAGAIKVVREEEKKGAIAKYYKATFPAMGIELPFGNQKINNFPVVNIDEKMQQFLSPIVVDGVFDGKIVVGSPDPHGPFKAKARDGHYAAYLTFFLGQFVKLPDDFAIKLDVDVKAEKDENNNLLASEHGFVLGGLVSEKTKKIYTADSMGVIARISNPWYPEKTVIVLAGNKAVGTKACVLALTKFWNKALKKFNGDKFAAVIQGFDLDGDGKVDSIEVLE
jgi:DNA-binding CsgD family transcriptional regulator